LTIEQRARIKVIVLGGAASISNRQYGTCVNYYCSNEPMLVLCFLPYHTLKRARL